MSMNEVEKQIADMSAEDAYKLLMNMGNWMKHFAKDNERRAERLTHLVKEAKKGFICPPYVEEAAAIVKRTAEDSERILRWFRLLDTVGEKADAEKAAEEAKQPSRS